MKTAGNVRQNVVCPTNNNVSVLQCNLINVRIILCVEHFYKVNVYLDCLTAKIDYVQLILCVKFLLKNFCVDNRIGHFCWLFDKDLALHL